MYIIILIYAREVPAAANINDDADITFLAPECCILKRGNNECSVRAHTNK